MKNLWSIFFKILLNSKLYGSMLCLITASSNPDTQATPTAGASDTTEANANTPR